MNVQHKNGTIIEHSVMKPSNGNGMITLFSFRNDLALMLNNKLMGTARGDLYKECELAQVKSLDLALNQDKKIKVTFTDQGIPQVQIATQTVGQGMRVMITNQIVNLTAQHEGNIIKMMKAFSYAFCEYIIEQVQGMKDGFKTVQRSFSPNGDFRYATSILHSYFSINCIRSFEERSLAVYRYEFISSCLNSLKSGDAGLVMKTMCRAENIYCCLLSNLYSLDSNLNSSFNEDKTKFYDFDRTSLILKTVDFLRIGQEYSIKQLSFNVSVPVVREQAFKQLFL